MASTARIVSLTILTVLIVFLAITFYQVIAPFLLPLFLAGVSAILCQPVFQYFLRRTNGRNRLSASLTTLSILAVILIPLAAGVSMATVQLVVFTQDWLEETDFDFRSNSNVEEVNQWLTETFGPDAAIDPDKLRQDLRDSSKKVLTALVERSRGIAGAAMGILGQIGSALMGGMMFVIALYYFLADGPALIDASEKLIPVHLDYQRQLLKQFEKAVRSVVMATFLAAITQGIATGIVVYIAGASVNAPLLKHFFIISTVATLASLIPIAGTWLVWGPVAIWLAVNGYWGWTLFVAGLGAGLIGTMDNVIRTYVLQSDTKLHPLLAFISVLGGLQAMGLWGIFIGPIVASCLHALIKIFNTEVKELSEEASAGDSGDDSSPRQTRSVKKPIRKSPAMKSQGNETAGEKRKSKTSTKSRRSRKRRKPKKKPGN